MSSLLSLGRGALSCSTSVVRGSASAAMGLVSGYQSSFGLVLSKKDASELEVIENVPTPLAMRSRRPWSFFGNKEITSPVQLRDEIKGLLYQRDIDFSSIGVEVRASDDEIYTLFHNPLFNELRPEEVKELFMYAVRYGRLNAALSIMRKSGRIFDKTDISNAFIKASECGHLNIVKYFGFYFRDQLSSYDYSRAMTKAGFWWKYSVVDYIMDNLVSGNDTVKKGCKFIAKHPILASIPLCALTYYAGPALASKAITHLAGYGKDLLLGSGRAALGLLGF